METAKPCGSPVSTRPLLLPGLLAASFLIGALMHMPYGYYVLLRWVVACAGTFMAWRSARCGQQGWVFPLALMAVIFNPLLPLHLTRQVWQPVDIAASVVFAARALTPEPRDLRR